MTVRQETSGQVVVCDGCGRTDAGPEADLYLESYLEHSDDQGYRMLHYCAGCALVRLKTGEITVELRPAAASR